MPAIIFDLDGTLVDSAAAICDIANAYMRERGLPALSLSEARGYIGHGAPSFLINALKARDGGYDEASFPKHFARYQQIYAEAPGSANAPFPGVVDTLKTLHAGGAKLAVCTNKPGAPTKIVLDAHGWGGYFDAVISGDTLEKRKPDPEPLYEAARRLGTTPVIYVGDSDVDAATAKAAAIPFFLFTEGYRKAEVKDLPHAVAFSDFSSLPGLIANHLKA
ncbi:MAG TPA: phosphoglycolate phosphatase [Hyphomicrobiaceae bacterium]|nr:phosphoglycolate phosphatase [Hyphomicrobiaceae bacterium]